MGLLLDVFEKEYKAMMGEFFSEELSETDILVAYREECSLQSFWIYFNL